MVEAATKPFEIVVLGGNFGGLGVTHYLLRHVIPDLRALDRDARFHITVVSPNANAFFKVGSPRTLVQPQLLPETQLWRPLSEAFEQYPSETITFIHAAARDLKPGERTVTLASATPGEALGREQIVPYDALFIATGTTAASPLWTLHEDESLTHRSFEALHKALPSAKTILIGGGGPVGVETAGELASVYGGGADITLLSGGTRLLQHVKSSLGARAQEQLHGLGVKMIHDVRVLSSSVAGPDHGSTRVSLSDGTSRSVDVYIDATGGTPNSQFMPGDWLDETGRVKTRDAYFRVAGDATDRTYALGDIVAGSGNTLFDLDAMVPTVCSAFAVDVAAQLSRGRSNAAPRPGLLGVLFGSSSKFPTEKEFKPMRETILVPIGPGGGVGSVLGWQVPSWFVRMAKSKSFLIDMFGPVVSGSKWKS